MEENLNPGMDALASVLKFGGAALAAVAVAFVAVAVSGNDIEMDVSDEFAKRAEQGKLTGRDYCDELDGLTRALNAYIEEQGGAEAVPNVQALCLPLALPR